MSLFIWTLEKDQYANSIKQKKLAVQSLIE